MLLTEYVLYRALVIHEFAAPSVYNVSLPWILCKCECEDSAIVIIVLQLNAKCHDYALPSENEKE